MSKHPSFTSISTKPITEPGSNHYEWYKLNENQERFITEATKQNEFKEPLKAIDNIGLHISFWHSQPKPASEINATILRKSNGIGFDKMYKTGTVIDLQSAKSLLKIAIEDAFEIVRTYLK